LLTPLRDLSFITGRSDHLHATTVRGNTLERTSIGSPRHVRTEVRVSYPLYRHVRESYVQFHVNRDVFSEAVSFVVKLLPQRNPQPILAGVLIEATEDGSLSLSAFDYEASARTTIE